MRWGEIFFTNGKILNFDSVRASPFLLQCDIHMIMLKATHDLTDRQVLPFVLLGLGVDDSFVICNAYGRTDPRKPINERMSESLGHSG